jgi:phosphatidylglycerol---prolipoprotein diacylglyceryl transferase
MHPLLFTLNLFGRDILVGTYGVMMATAFAAGIAATLAVARRHGHRPGYFINHCLLVSAFVIGGSLLAGFIIFLPERAAAGFVDYPPALVSWGGILGGLTALIFIKYNWKESFLHIADLGAPGFFIGMGIGRIGCFFAGCCYGVHTATCIGVTFTDRLAPAAALPQPLVPTQLISAVFLLCAGAAFVPFTVKNKIPGRAFALAALIYSLSRFTIEFWRDDPRAFVLGLSDGQVFSLGFFLLGLAVFIYIAWKRLRYTAPSQ